MPHTIDKTVPAISIGRSDRNAALCVAALLLASSAAHATEPDQRAIACLTSVLRSSPQAVSVTPAADIPFYADGYKLARKGVDYTFRKPDGAQQTVGVYIATEWKQKDYTPEPNEVPIAGSIPFVPDDNHRYQLSLRPPYPESWYPLAKVVGTPTAETFVQQLSPEHPLYTLWSKLADQCAIENLDVNSGWVP